LYKEEMLSLQRSWIIWLRKRIVIRAFFYQKVVWRERRNKTKKLKDDQGVWNDVPTGMERMATSYFKELFTRDPSVNANTLISLMQKSDY
jgi:hypothetical protein